MYGSAHAISMMKRWQSQTHRRNSMSAFLALENFTNCLRRRLTELFFHQECEGCEAWKASIGTSKPVMRNRSGHESGRLDPFRTEIEVGQSGIRKACSTFDTFESSQEKSMSMMGSADMEEENGCCLQRKRGCFLTDRLTDLHRLMPKSCWWSVELG
ncbi:hypothetical protein Mapa_017180 [Marchantia paleacea]|nr:hypothetical protein Mapa_017180 [Marchantia paleacea]